ncbi:MAG TPA: efflux RND transporter periplasmic adaptor subunit [Thermodesulfobacteriota bacterium]|nr:efflux RND transporter periplasmic adaptor subunit [Thermodesulfobacteriota bacterium]
MKRKKLIPLFIILIAGGALLYYYFFLRPSDGEGTDIAVSGNIEVTTVDVSFKIPGKIEKLAVDEGDPVKQGQVIATLEHRDLVAQKVRAEATLEATQTRIPSLQKNIELQDRSTRDEISQAEAAVQAAQARLQQLLAGSRPQEIQAAKAGVDQAESDLVKRKADRERAEKLFKSNFIAAQDLDAAINAHDVAAANLKKARETYALVVEGPRKEEIDAARAQYEQAQAALQLARAHRLQLEVLRKDLLTAQAQVKEASTAIAVIDTQIGYTQLLAPLSGVVLVKNAEAGEYVVPGGALVSLGDLERPWLKAFINENDLGRVKLGQKVSVTTDSYPGKIYPGKITFISSEAEFTPKNVQTAKERVKLVYRIKVALENPHGELKPGMPADGRIHTE